MKTFKSMHKVKQRKNRGGSPTLSQLSVEIRNYDALHHVTFAQERHDDQGSKKKEAKCIRLTHVLNQMQILENPLPIALWPMTKIRCCVGQCGTNYHRIHE